MRTSIALLLVLAAACGDDDAPRDAAADGNLPDAPPDAGADAPTTDAGTDAGSCEAGETPLRRRENAAAYDTTRDRLLVYGGNVAVVENCRPATENTDELWAFDPNCGSWQQLTYTGGPGPRARHTMHYDEANDRVILFGGRIGGDNITPFNDVWALDAETLAWTEISTSGTPPSPRFNHMSVLDSPRNRLIVFGGNGATGFISSPLGDAFALDLDTGVWTEIDSSDGPGLRYYAAATRVGDTMYVFGGQDMFNVPYYNDLWALDLTTDTWSLVRDGGPDAPPQRFSSFLFHDAANNRLLIGAGHDATDLGNTNDLWALDLGSLTWTELQHGDTLNSRPLGMCRFPADFTTPDLNAPERRSAFAWAQSAGRGFVAFGSTDCGAVNDVWAADFASSRWELVGNNSTSGEACNRSGAVGCTELCF